MYKAKLKKAFTFRFQPDKYTLIAFLLGGLSFGVGYLMRLTDNAVLLYIFRDVLQVMFIGVVVPFFILSTKNEFQEAGLRIDKGLRYILISVMLGALLTFQFYTEEGDRLFDLTIAHIEPALYVMVTNIFEILFFVIFLRFYFEKAFGIIPAIIMASAFFSLHHIGFQPEFYKLFLVGLFFMVIFRIVNHWLILIPLWWVGGLGDVLVKSTEVSGLESMHWWRSMVILLIITLMFIYKQPFKRIDKGGI